MVLRINFGKYKGRLIKNLVKTDLNYCKWLFNQTSTSKEIKEYIYFYQLALLNHKVNNHWFAINSGFAHL